MGAWEIRCLQHIGFALSLFCHQMSNLEQRMTAFSQKYSERERDADSTTTLTNLVTYTLKRQYAVVVDRPRLTDPSLANRRSPSYCHTAGTGNI